MRALHNSFRRNSLFAFGERRSLASREERLKSIAAKASNEHGGSLQGRWRRVSPGVLRRLLICCSGTCAQHVDCRRLRPPCQRTLTRARVFLVPAQTDVLNPKSYPHRRGPEGRPSVRSLTCGVRLLLRRGDREKLESALGAGLARVARGREGGGTRSRGRAHLDKPASGRGRSIQSDVGM